MRPNIGTNGKTIPLRANYFKVKIPDTDLHHYDVDIRPDKCPRRVNREIIENMVENFRSRIFQVFIFTIFSKHFYYINLGSSTRIRWPKKYVYSSSSAN